MLHRTLIIGDVHHHTDLADALIHKHVGRYDQIVFLGDYFDEYRDSPAAMRATCRWLVASLQEPNRIHLLGNHDLAYRFPQNPRARCPGHTPDKQAVFDELMGHVPGTAFMPAIAIGSWLLSHAGVTAARTDSRSAAAVAELLTAELTTIQAGGDSWILDVARARGGTAAQGGPFWLDWNSEFRPVPGLNQIVGHTPSRGTARAKCLTKEGNHRAFELVEPSPWPRMSQLPQVGQEWTSINWCVDTAQVFVGLLENGCFELLV